MTFVREEAVRLRTLTRSRQIPPPVPSAARRRRLQYVTLEQVYKQLVDLFPFAFTSFLEELIGVFLTPYLCIWHIPASCGSMLAFLKANSAAHKDIGVVCSQAKFNFVEHGNPKCG